MTATARSASGEEETKPGSGLWGAAMVASTLGAGLAALTLLTRGADGIRYVPPDGQLSLSTPQKPVQEGAATEVFVCARDSVGQPVGKAGARLLAPNGTARPNHVRVQVHSPTGGRFVKSDQTCDDMKSTCSRRCLGKDADFSVKCIETCLDVHTGCMANALTEHGSTGVTVLFDGSTECQTLWFKQDAGGPAELLAQSGIHRDRVNLTIMPDSADATEGPSHGGASPRPGTAPSAAAATALAVEAPVPPAVSRVKSVRR
jgi:hypothetical protein